MSKGFGIFLVIIGLLLLISPGLAGAGLGIFGAFLGAIAGIFGAIIGTVAGLLGGLLGVAGGILGVFLGAVITIAILGAPIIFLILILVGLSKLCTR